MGDLSQAQINSLEAVLGQQGVNQSMAQALLLWNNPDRALNELILEKPENGARKAKPANKQRPEIASVFKLFPNPAKDYFTLQYGSDMDNMQNISIIITDMQGRIIRKIKQNNSLDMMVNTKDLQSGVYTVSLYNDKLLLDKKRLTIVK